MIKPIQKLVLLARGVLAFVRIVRDPNRLDEVFELSDHANLHEVLSRIAGELRAKDPKCARALDVCRRLPSYKLSDLAQLERGTLGREFAEHMISRKLDPAAIPTLNAKDPAEFVKAHLYETHDVWHVVTGFDTDVAGELGLQAFYLSQTHGPLPATLLAAGLLNAAFFATHDFDARMRNIAEGWRLGKRAAQLFGTDWDLSWERRLEDVRREHGIDPRGVQAALGYEAQVRPRLGQLSDLELSPEVAH